ncbi:MAG: hypothetical protein CSB44_01560, partial [Gammaproteobacteria bacterium]
LRHGDVMLDKFLTTSSVDGQRADASQFAVNAYLTQILDPAPQLIDDLVGLFERAGPGRFSELRHGDVMLDRFLTPSSVD